MTQVQVRNVRYAWHNPYKVTLGETYARFLEGLKNKKILGNICPKCRGLYVPARPFCDDCFEEPQEWVEMEQVAALITFTVAYVKFLGLPDPPNITGMIKVGDSITNFLHKVGGIEYDDPRDLEKKVKVGMKLKPVWREKRVGDMLDIDYFAPA